MGHVMHQVVAADTINLRGAQTTEITGTGTVRCVTGMTDRITILKLGPGVTISADGNIETSTRTPAPGGVTLAFMPSQRKLIEVAAAPHAHTHAVADITDYVPGGDGGPHTHPQSDITGLEAALDGKVATTDPRLSDARIPLAHSHVKSDISDFAHSHAEYALADHTHPGGTTSWGGITGTLANQTDLATALGGKSATGHGHVIGDTSGLQAALDGKAAISHSHPEYAAASHNHDAAYAAIDHTHPAAPGGVAFPVDSVFISFSNTNPATTLGYGTWESVGAGRVLVGVDAGDPDFASAGLTGGAKTSSAVVNHTHGVTITDPGHAHVQGVNSATTGGLSGYTPDTSTNSRVNSGYSTSSATTGISAATSNPAGGVASFSLMNPFLSVYFWRRTA